MCDSPLRGHNPDSLTIHHVLNLRKWDRPEKGAADFLGSEKAVDFRESFRDTEKGYPARDRKPGEALGVLRSKWLIVADKCQSPAKLLYWRLTFFAPPLPGRTQGENMEYRYLGKSGLKVSALSFGAWVTFDDQMDVSAAHECMKTAFDAGVNFFDNAEVYADGMAETIMGEVLKKAGWARKDLVISTKIFWGGQGPNDRGLSRKHILEGTDAALKRLQLDYVDLIFCHRPDVDTPIEETVWAMNHILNQGKALYWGTSEWSAAQIRRAHDIARREHLIPPTMEQPQYNMFVRDRVEQEYAELYDEIGLGTTIWSPLASGILTGKYNDGIPEGSRMSLPNYQWLLPELEGEAGRQKVAKVRQLTPIAQELGCTMAQLALAWCLSNDDVSTVITGASRNQQVVENLKALEVAEQLTPDVQENIETILNNKPNPEKNWRG
jgi:voltage-dependent potassium channel beta subunit